MSVDETKKVTLSTDEISRYSRQLILPEIGVQGQLSLKSGSVLIVGAGGLGCPAAVYLAAAGIGKLGVVDYDDIEISNLHRQILHSENCLGQSKAQSIATSVKKLNSNVECIVYKTMLNTQNAQEIILQFDVVVDATDNVATRYLLNDACVLCKRPLVSGSALRFVGQLTVYNFQGGPCYRCIFPVPPQPETVTNCSDAGVVGAVPGIIGTLQALEVIKILSGLSVSYSQKLLLYDGLSEQQPFRVIPLRPRKLDCDICGENPTITSLIDYEQFCGQRASDKDTSLELLPDEDRLSCKEYKELLDKGSPHILLDVRTQLEYDICHLPNSYNIPFIEFEDDKRVSALQNCISSLLSKENPKQVFIICRRGNDSQRAVVILQKLFKNDNVLFKDLKGGLHAWAREIDETFPVY